MNLCNRARNKIFNPPQIFFSTRHVDSYYAIKKSVRRTPSAALLPFSNVRFWWNLVCTMGVNSILLGVGNDRSILRGVKRGMNFSVVFCPRHFCPSALSDFDGIRYLVTYRGLADTPKIWLWSVNFKGGKRGDEVYRRFLSAALLPFSFFRFWGNLVWWYIWGSSWSS